MQAGNPYIAGSPLRDPEGFFGRLDILDWVLAEFSNIHTNALVLYGQRRVGKTTILLQLRHYLPSDKFLPIYFDLQDQAKSRLGDVLANLADAVGSLIDLSEHKPESFDDNGKYFRSVFLPDLYRVLAKGCRPVFLLDEFDVLDQGDEGALEDNLASRALFPFLRQVMDDDIHSAFVFVVGRRTEDLRVDFNQMFKTSLTKEVWVLDRQSAETLVRQAEVNETLKFTQQSIDRILQLTESHAYLTQLVCQRLWQRAYAGKPAAIPTIDVDDVTASIPDALEVGDQALIWLWNGLGPAEKIYASVLAEISDEGRAISEDQVIKVLAEHAARARLRRREVELAPQDLITRHVLELTDNREYLFAIELFRRWVKQKRSLKDVVDEIDKVDPLAQKLFELGHDFYKERKWNDAVRYFNDALQQNPSHFRANLLLGETFLVMGQTEDAVRQLEIAYSLDSYESQYPLARALIALAKEKEKNGFDQDALSAAERALVVSPNERLAQDIKKSILERQGDNALKQGDLVSALSAFEKAGSAEKIEQVEREYKRIALQTLEQEAESLTRKMDWKQAISVYEQLVEKAPDEKSKVIWQSSLAKCKEEEKLESLFTLGLGSLSRGDWEQAKKTLSEVVYIRPDYSKDNKSAVKLLEQAVVGRKPITVEAIFQSTWFRVLGSVSLVVVLGYLLFSAFWRVDTDATNPTQIVASATVTKTPTVEITDTPQPTLTPHPTLSPTPTPNLSSFSLYDDFSNGSSSNPYDTALWRDPGGKANINWQDGYLVFSGTNDGHELRVREPVGWSIDEIGRLQADLRIDNVSGAYGFSKIGIDTNISGKGAWWVQCRAGSFDGKTAQIICDSYRWSDATHVDRTKAYSIEFGKFYTVAIEIAPDASYVRFYVDGKNIGDYQSEEKDLLVKANFSWSVGLYLDTGATATGAVDNVKIGTLMQTYDDFKNTSYDGSFNTSLWSKAGDNTLNVSQQNGALTFVTTNAKRGGENVLLMKKPSVRSIDSIQFFEARLKVDEFQKGFSFAKIQIMAENINGYTWNTQCGLGWDGGTSFICIVDHFDSSGRTEEYRSDVVKTKLNTWYTVRIEIDPMTATNHFYLDGVEIGTFTPKDANKLTTANNFVPRVGVWDESTDSIFKYEITDVWITP